jgi:hypothetical protein
MKKYIMEILLLTVVSSLIGFAAADSPNSDNYQVTIYVNGNTGLDINDGSINHPVKSVRKAIDIAPDYATIQIVNGVYTGENNTNLVGIAKNLKFVGESKESTIFDGNGAGWIFGTNFDGVTINNVSFENLTLKNVKRVGILLKQVDYIGYQNWLDNRANSTEQFKDKRYIRNCNFQNNTESVLFGTGGYTISDSTFENNNNTLCGTLFIHASTNVDNNIFLNNHAFNGQGGAIYVSSGYVKLSSNFFNGNTATNAGNSIAITSEGDVSIGDKNSWGILGETDLNKLPCEIAGYFTRFTEP